MESARRVTNIARRAGVDRTFLYHHRDLLERIHAAKIQPPDKLEIGPQVTRASLQADLLAAQQRCARMAARTQQLETRLSELLGEQAWRASGLGAHTDIDQLQQRIVTHRKCLHHTCCAPYASAARPRELRKRQGHYNGSGRDPQRTDRIP